MSLADTIKYATGISCGAHNTLKRKTIERKFSKETIMRYQL